jgi:hypothetical protein
MSKWIAVKDQMPAPGQFVLAYGDQCQGMIDGPKISVFHWVHEDWFDANMDYELTTAPTHWMPLPDPPQA